MERGQFTFYRSFWEAVKELPAKEKTAVICAVCAYALDGEEPSLSGTAKAIFTLIRPTLDTSARKSENGKAKSKSKSNAMQTGSKPEANTNQTVKEKEKEVEVEIEKEIEVESEVERENECSPPITDPPQKKKFIPPTAKEVAEYCEQSGYIVDAQRFVSWYTSNGWRVGKNPMKDWQAAVRTWALKDKQGNPRNRAPRDEDYYDEEAI